MNFKGKFLTGDNMTIADISIAASLSMPSLMNQTFEAYPKVDAWLKTMNVSLNWISWPQRVENAFVESTFTIFKHLFRRSRKCKQLMLDFNQQELKSKRNWRKKENCNLLFDHLEYFETKTKHTDKPHCNIYLWVKYRQIHHHLNPLVLRRGMIFGPLKDR